MNQRVGIALSSVVLAVCACDFNAARRCGADSDCQNGAACDTSRGVCFGAADGGTLTPTLTLFPPAPPARTPPEGGAFGVPADATSYLRGEKLEYGVATNFRFASGEVQVFASPQDAGAMQIGSVSPAPCPSGVDAGNCGTFVVDLSTLPLKGLRGTYELRVQGRPNGVVAEATGTIPVTRFKWALKLATGFTASPAIGPKGHLYVGGHESGAKLFSLTPEGTARWPGGVEFGGIKATPAVGTDGGLVYFAGTGSNAYLYALDTADGGTQAQCGNGPAPIAGDFETALTVLKPLGEASQTDWAVGLSRDSDGTLTGMRAGATSARCLSTLTSTQSRAPSTLVSSGGALYFGDVAGNVNAFEARTMPLSWALLSGWENGRRAIPSMANSMAALAIDEGKIFGTIRPGSGFALDAADAGNLTFVNEPVSASPGSVAVDKDGYLFFGDGASRLLKGKPGEAAAKQSVVPAAIRATPVLGSNGLVYTVDSAGNLQVWDRDLVLQWSEQLTTAGFSASPNLDCARAADGAVVAGPGTLYLASLDGRLFAIQVDSSQLDIRAKWPKYQHDARNSGNSTSSLACP